MIIETKFKPLDSIVYLEKDGSDRVVKNGRIGAVKVIATGEYDLQIFYVLYDKKEIHEIYCYSSLEELKATLLSDNEYRIRGLGVGSVVKSI